MSHFLLGMHNPCRKIMHLLFYASNVITRPTFRYAYSTQLIMKDIQTQIVCFDDHPFCAWPQTDVHTVFASRPV